MILASLQHASLGYAGRLVLNDVTLHIQQGEIYCLLGVNGSGKTTLLRTLSGLLAPLSGQVLLMGKPLHCWTARQRARQISCVPQIQRTPFAFTALEMVLMGFHSQLSWLASPGQYQREQAMQAMQNLHIAPLAQRSFPTLSGGEQQLVLIARALVQQPRLLVMDEPAASLDFAHQIRLLETLRQLKQQGVTLVMSTHHPLHADALADRVVLIHQDGRLTSGDTTQQLSLTSLAALYQVSPAAMYRHLSLRADRENVYAD